MQQEQTRLRVKVQDPSGRPGYYRKVYGTDEGYVETDGRSQYGSPDLMVYFDSGKSGLIPSGRIVYVKDQPKADFQEATDGQRTAVYYSLREAYLQVQRWQDRGHTGLAIKQLPSGAWYASYGPTGQQAA